MKTGTIHNTVKLNMLTQEWNQKKDSGNVLSKRERNERANWSAEQRQLNDFKEQLEREKEGTKRNEIANKISSGQKLTPEEEQYLASYDPQGLADYKQTQNERKAYEEKLKNCKTKDDVQKLKTTTLGNHLTTLKKIINNPVIPLSEKLKKAQQILGKTKNIQAAEEEFIESGEYEELPTEMEQREEEASTTETIVSPSESGFEKERREESSTDVTGTPESIASEIEDIHDSLVINMQKSTDSESVKSNQSEDDDIGEIIETEEEKRIGKKVDLSV